MNKTKGGVTIKNIHGRKYYYYQWYEDGKRKSRTISEDEYYDLVSNKSSLPQRNVKYSSFFGLKILTGDDLLSSISFVASWKKRDCYSNLKNYIESPCNGKILIIYGLRRSGKTSLMYQSILQHKDEIDKTAYILVDSHSTMGDINLALNDLIQKGFKYIYIDEITMANDFISSSQFLSDIYGLRAKIVLSGTDSLGFSIAMSDALYDRCYLIHTTYIPFKEFSYLLDINDIDKYIEFGGTLVKEGIDYHSDNTPTFYNAQTARAYIDTAIANNIQNSLKNYNDGEKFKRIRGLKESGSLSSLIYKVVQDSNHRFVKESLNRVFKSQDYGSLKELLRSNPDSDVRTILENVDSLTIYNELMKKLEINNEEVDQESIDELYRYFKMLDIIDDVSVIDLENNVVTKDVIFVQPGLRYAMAKELVEVLLYEGELIDIPGPSLDIVFQTLLNDVKGRILEEIVLLDEKRRDVNNVYRASFMIGEIDMCLKRKNRNECSLYEIKHSDKKDKHQIRHLIDKEKLDLIEYRFSKIKEKGIIYRGPDSQEGEIKYINVEKYLKR